MSKISPAYSSPSPSPSSSPSPSPSSSPSGSAPSVSSPTTGGSSTGSLNYSSPLQQYNGESEFVKTLNGAEAPAGFHYMPNGRLMNDADHIAVHGYLDKKIFSFTMETNDISHLGESRPFRIDGDTGAYFSMEAFTVDSNGNALKHYDFYSHQWLDVKSGSINRVRLNGSYTSEIKFAEYPSGSLSTCKVRVVAETVNNCRTSHVAAVEVRNLDGSLNVNDSTGSNSNIIEKILYQDVAKNLHISCIAPSMYTASTGTVNGATSSSNRAIIDQSVVAKKVTSGDLLTTGEALIATWVLINAPNPDSDNINEIEMNVTESFTDGVTLTFTPAFNGVTPHDSDSTTGRDSFEISSGGSGVYTFELNITAPVGRTLSVIKTPTTNDLCFYKNIVIGSSGLAITGENTDSDRLFYRWPVTNITGLTNSMRLDPSRASSVSSSSIRDYGVEEIVKQETNIGGIKYTQNKKIIKNKIKGVDASNNDVTAVDRNGVITAQAGNVTFADQQTGIGGSTIKVFGYGQSGISSLTGGMEVALSDIEITPTDYYITTSSATSGSTTIPVASTDGGTANVSVGATISGVNINSSVANPTVTYKSAQTGAGNITVSSAQTLEDGQKLLVKGKTKSLKVTGKLKVSGFPLTDTSIYFDLERFISSI